MKDAKGHGSNGKSDWATGRDARRDGAARTDNPHTDPTAKGEWDRGFRQASRGQPVTSNAAAAQSLMSGLKSTMVPVHDSMSGTTDRAVIKDQVYNMLKGMGPARHFEVLMANVSTSVADVVVPKGNFSRYRQQRGYSNETAASELYSGKKSKKVPIHDSMAGYDGTPKPSDNIMARARRRGYITYAS